jgi:hypothetical protein
MAAIMVATASIMVPIILPNLQEEMEQKFVFNVSSHRKVQGCLIRRSWWPSYRFTTSNPSNHHAIEVGSNLAMEVRGYPIVLKNEMKLY